MAVRYTRSVIWGRVFTVEGRWNGLMFLPEHSSTSPQMVMRQIHTQKKDHNLQDGINEIQEERNKKGVTRLANHDTHPTTQWNKWMNADASYIRTYITDSYGFLLKCGPESTIWCLYKYSTIQHTFCADRTGDTRQRDFLISNLVTQSTHDQLVYTLQSLANNS